AAARAEAGAAAQLPALRTAATRVGAALQRLAHARDALDADEKRVKTRLGEIGRQLAQLTDDIAREQRMLADHRAILARLHEEERGLEAANAALAERHTSASARRRLAEAALAESEAAMAKLTERHAEIAAQRGEYQRAIADASERVTRLANEIAAIASERDTVDGAAAEAALRAAREQAAAARDVLADGEHRLGRMEAEAATLAAVLASGSVDGRTPLLDAVKVAPGYEMA